MYCDFFDLKLLPFNNTPDPRFYFNTPDHEEALASLIYAAEERKGFVLVTGEVGAGKTLLSRILLSKLSPGVKTAVITNTRLTGHELLLSICREFELEVDEEATSTEISNALERFLLEQYSRDRLAVVILDEAQNLPIESFEELRMLGNLEADDAKLLQILILGQPELQRSFSQPSMRQLYQRIFRTFHLKAMERKLTEGYIRHRLGVAGIAEDVELFEPAAIDAIYRHSEGIPRLVNQICDNAMLAAYTDSKKVITARIINEVVDQMLALKVAGDPGRPLSAFAQQMLGQTPPLAPAQQPPAPSIDNTANAIANASAIANANAIASANASTNAIVNANANMVADKFSTMDHVMQRIADRLERSEQSLAQIRKHRSLSKDQKRVANAELEEARALRRQAAEMMRELREAGARTDERVQRLVEQAKNVSTEVERKAAESLDESQKQTAVFHAQARNLLEEVHAYTKGRQAHVADLLTKERAEFEAAHEMRKQASVLLKEVTKTTQQANERIRDILGDAQECADSVKKQAAASLQETASQNAALRDQIKQLMEEVAERQQSQDQHVSELVAKHQSEFDVARRQVAALRDAMRQRDEEQARRGDEMLQYLRTQVRALNEQLEQHHGKAEKRAGEMNEKLNDMLKQMTDRVEQARGDLLGTISATQQQSMETLDAIKHARDEAVKGAEDGQRQMTELIQQTQDLLLKTREKSAAMLVDLRSDVTQQTEKAEQIWQTAIAEGARTLQDLTDRLTETRLKTEHCRSEFEAFVQSANNEITNARNAFESGLNTHKSEVARLTNDAASIKENIAKRFDEAMRELDESFQRHHHDLRKRVVDLIGRSDENVGLAENRAKDMAESLRSELEKASQSAGRIFADLQKSISAVEQNANECKTRYEGESQKLIQKLGEVVTQGRADVENAQTHIAALSQQAANTIDKVNAKIEEIRHAAKTSVTDTSRHLDACIEEAMQTADKIHADAESFSASVAARVVQTRKEVDTSISRAEKIVLSLREQGKNSLVGVRTALSQMNKRAELIQRDIVQMGDEITDSAKGSIRQLHQTSAGITEQVESLREAAQRDADGNVRRLQALREQVEHGAEQIRQNAGKLLDQVQVGTASLREHANELLTKAQSGSDRVGEQASNLLMQAHKSAEKFREQAEALLRRSEATAEALRNDIQVIRTDILKDSEKVREDLHTAKREISEKREESVAFINETRSREEEIHQRTEELLAQATDIRSRTEELLNLPIQLVEEAREKTAALADMSGKVTRVVKQLSSAGGEAQKNRDDLQEATTAANETVEMLKRHTARVGQLVGLIRQLYGTMDARIERLRSRLGAADEICRAVPAEIDNLKAALTDEIVTPAATVQRLPAKSVSKPTSVVSPPQKPGAQRVTQVPIEKGSLGEIAQGNKRLNKWLRDILTETDQPGGQTVQSPPAERLKSHEKAGT